MKFKKTLTACALALFSVFTMGNVQAASNSVQNVIDETYVQPDYVLGYSLSEDQRNQTLSLLGSAGIAPEIAGCSVAADTLPSSRRPHTRTESLYPKQAPQSQLPVSAQTRTV